MGPTASCSDFLQVVDPHLAASDMWMRSHLAAEALILHVPLDDTRNQDSVIIDLIISFIITFIITFLSCFNWHFDTSAPPSFALAHVALFHLMLLFILLLLRHNKQELFSPRVSSKHAGLDTTSISVLLVNLNGV